MADTPTVPSPAGELWESAQRIERWAGEVRVNLVRVCGIVLLYGQHLVNVYLLRDNPGIVDIHLQVTLIALAWGSLALGVHVAAGRRWIPPWLSAAVVACDLALATMLLLIVRNPQSTLVVVYLLVVVSAPLRMSLPLVYFAGAGSLLACGAYLWIVRYVLEFPAEQRMARPSQAVLAAGLIVAALLAGQSVRQARRLVRGYPVRGCPVTNDSAE